MSEIFQLLGFAGTVIVAVAYLPQILHLTKEHCSAGVSVRAWVLWLLASALIFTHAFDVFDYVFMALQVVNIVAIVLIIVMAKRYTRMVCASHKVIAAYKGKKGKR